ncbi:hypothetical protein VNO78_07885 [Psophocarpus tetragonolobus]|uniref:Uncharacterized protein n=1 Tax=Psophocarpus tetragonolobus TaxID=3891 RepID=A0AAN9SVE4_PSOTE
MSNRLYQIQYRIILLFYTIDLEHFCVEKYSQSKNISSSRFFMQFGTSDTSLWYEEGDQEFALEEEVRFEHVFGEVNVVANNLARSGHLLDTKYMSWNSSFEDLPPLLANDPVT